MPGISAGNIHRGIARAVKMSLLIGKYEFEGPFINWLGVQEKPGIYLVMSFANQEYELVEIGESDNLRLTVLNQNNLESWQCRSNGMLTYSVHYIPAVSWLRRREIVNEILREYDGNCRSYQCDRELVASGSR